MEKETPKKAPIPNFWGVICKDSLMRHILFRQKIMAKTKPSEFRKRSNVLKEIRSSCFFEF
jgi:hypothetical protein